MEANGKLRLEEMKMMRDLFSMSKDDHDKTRRKLEETLEETKKSREESKAALKEGFEEVKKSQNKISEAVAEGFSQVDDTFAEQNANVAAFRAEVGASVGELTQNVYDFRDAAATCLEVQHKQICEMLFWMKKADTYLELVNLRTRCLANDGGWGYIDYPRGPSGGSTDVPAVPLLRSGGTLGKIDELKTSKKGVAKKKEIDEKYKKSVIGKVRGSLTATVGKLKSLVNAGARRVAYATHDWDDAPANDDETQDDDDGGGGDGGVEVQVLDEEREEDSNIEAESEGESDISADVTA